MQPVGDDIETQHVGIRAPHHDSVGIQRVQLLLRRRAERRRVEGDGLIVKNGQRGIQVVEPRIHQLKGGHRHPQRRRDLAVRAAVGAKAVTGQHHFADHQQVALALIDISGDQRRIAHRRHPIGVGPASPARCS